MKQFVIGFVLAAAAVLTTVTVVRGRVERPVSAIPPAQAALPAAGGTGPATGEPGLAAGLLNGINTLRAQAGLRPLSQEPALDHVAAQHALQMGARDYYGSYGVDGAPLVRMRAAGFRGGACWTEVVAAWYPTAESLLPVLVAQPGVRFYLLQPPLTRVGVAAVRVPGSRYGVYWTIDAGRAAGE